MDNTDFWWITSITGGIAVVMSAVAMKSVTSTIVMFFMTCFAIAACIIALAWDWFRWHWPFLPIQIQQQIEAARPLWLEKDGYKFWEWERQTLKIIQELWGIESEQGRNFQTLVTGPTGNPQLDLHLQLEILKNLDPRRQRDVGNLSVN